MKIIVIVDAQKDFCQDFESKLVVENIKTYLEQQKAAEPCFIIFTQDCHYEDAYERSVESYFYPPHCIPDTDGFEIVDELKPYAGISFRKDSFTSAELCNTIVHYVSSLEYDKVNDRVEVEICGFLTDICVISNALLIRSMNPTLDISVLSNLCKGSDEESHRAALQVMKNCLIEVKEV